MRSEVAASERRACGLMVLNRGTCRYHSRRPEDTALRTRLRELAEAPISGAFPIVSHEVWVNQLFG